MSVVCFLTTARVRVSSRRRWIDACHARGVPCLGTLITEHAAGAADNALLLEVLKYVKYGGLVTTMTAMASWQRLVATEAGAPPCLPRAPR